MNNKLTEYIRDRILEFDNIKNDRKILLKEISVYIKENLGIGINLIFICTHNSRRSHLAQIWSQTAALYYDIEGIKCFSGGTEATAFYPSAVDALRKSGFTINHKGSENNPVYNVQYDDSVEPLKCFSKVYNDDFNPKENFAAIMTCSEAEKNCPYIPGADKRFAVTYKDPKEFDGTDEEEIKYDERCGEISREMLYIFSTVK